MSSSALRMPGVVAMLTADEVPQEPAANPILTNEPTFVGAPDPGGGRYRRTDGRRCRRGHRGRAGAAALRASIRWKACRPAAPTPAATAMSAASASPLQTVKWDAGDFAAGRRPPSRRQDGRSWQYGDLDGGFADAKLVLEESFVTASMPHHSAGDAFRPGLLAERQMLPAWLVAKPHLHRCRGWRNIGIEPANLVFIGEFCGGGFGSKGGAYPHDGAAGASWRKKTGRPVMHADQPRARNISSARRAMASRAASRSASPPTGGSPRWTSVWSRIRAASSAPRLSQRRRRPVHCLSAAGHALERHAGVHQHAALRPDARPRPEPDGGGDRAADRQGGAAAGHRPAWPSAASMRPSAGSTYGAKREP